MTFSLRRSSAVVHFFSGIAGGPTETLSPSDH